MGRTSDGRASDSAWYEARASVRRRFLGMRRSSRYLTMRDGVRLAIDVTLPTGAQVAPRSLPTILRQTRYYRRVATRIDALSPRVEPAFDNMSAVRELMVRCGYAWIDVCVRGSGASFGRRRYPWSPDELADGAEIVDWIVRQPWSNGRVGATGISYDGTAAELLVTHHHPAVRAVAPLFSLFDAYHDVAFPGGNHLSWFTERWARFNGLLDDGRLGEAVAEMVALYIEGYADVAQGVGAVLWRRLDSDLQRASLVATMRALRFGAAPVDDDAQGHHVAQAIAEHASNFDVHRAASGLTFRDERRIAEDEDPDGTIDAFSPHAMWEAIASSGVPIYSYSGYMDGAYQRAATTRFANLEAGRGHRLILGPWDHGGKQHISPHSQAYRASFRHEVELLRFFDAHLRPDGAPLDDAPVHYFTMGEERWKEAESWPPPQAEVVPFYFAEGGLLRREPPLVAGAVDVYRVDFRHGTGPRSRWRSLLSQRAPLGYGDRARRDASLLVYDSAPLPFAIEVSGHPVVAIWVRADAPDAQIFAYLEEVSPSGEVTVVTEGHLRARHRTLVTPEVVGYRSPAGIERSFRREHDAPLEPGRMAELRFDLLPVSYRFGRRSQIRLARAGADIDHFKRLPDMASTWTVAREARRPSHVALPIVAPG